MNGQSWRPGFFYKGLPKQSKHRVGQLKVQLDANTINASFNPLNNKQQPLQLNVALLGMGFKTNIKAGENEGRYSQHEFVVLKHQTFDDNNGRWNINWSATSRVKANQYAVAIWVNSRDNLTPIQATGTYLPTGFIK